MTRLGFPSGAKPSPAPACLSLSPSLSAINLASASDNQARF